MSRSTDSNAFRSLTRPGIGWWPIIPAAIALLVLSACAEDNGPQDASNDDRPTIDAAAGTSDDNDDFAVPPLYLVETAEDEAGDPVASMLTYGQEPVSQMDALMEGDLALSGECLGVASHHDGSFVPVVWPYGYSVGLEDGEAVLLDENGDVIAREGEPISMGGGNVPDNDGDIGEVAPVDCQAGGYWLAGSEVRPGSWNQEPGLDDEDTADREVQSPDEAWEHDAQAYADSMGISLDEALFRMDMMGRLGDEQQALMEGEAGRFGGLFWEHEPEFRLVVMMTDGDDDTVREYFEDPEIQDILDVRTVEYTYQELLDTQQEVMDLLIELDLLVSSGVDVQENRVEIYAADPDLVRNALEAAGEAVPDNVVLVEEEEFETLDEPEDRGDDQ